MGPPQTVLKRPAGLKEDPKAIKSRLGSRGRGRGRGRGRPAAKASLATTGKGSTRPKPGSAEDIAVDVTSPGGSEDEADAEDDEEEEEEDDAESDDWAVAPKVLRKPAGSAAEQRRGSPVTASVGRGRALPDVGSKTRPAGLGRGGGKGKGKRSRKKLGGVAAEATKRAGEVGRAISRITSLRDLEEDPYGDLEGSLIYVKEDADTTYAIQITEAAVPDPDGVFCDGVFRGSSCSKVDATMKNRVVLWHFCRGRASRCPAVPPQADRQVIHLKSWRIAGEQSEPVWLRPLAIDDDRPGPDNFGGETEARGILGMAAAEKVAIGLDRPSALRKSPDGGPPDIGKLKDKLSALKRKLSGDTKPAAPPSVTEPSEVDAILRELKSLEEVLRRKGGKTTGQGWEDSVSADLRARAAASSSRTWDFPYDREPLPEKDKKKRKKKKKKRDRDDSSTSSSSNSSGHIFRESRGSRHGASLVSKAKRCPGSLAKEILKKMRQFIMTQQGTSADGTLRPVCLAYLTSVLIPSLGGEVGTRNVEELRCMASAMDAMLSGNPAQALDIMASRFSAVETLATTKDWNVAKHLQIVPSEHVSCVNEDYMDYARRRRRSDTRTYE